MVFFWWQSLFSLAPGCLEPTNSTLTGCTERVQFLCGEQNLLRATCSSPTLIRKSKMPTANIAPLHRYSHGAGERAAFHIPFAYVWNAVGGESKRAFGRQDTFIWDARLKGPVVITIIQIFLWDRVALTQCGTFSLLRGIQFLSWYSTVLCNSGSHIYSPCSPSQYQVLLTQHRYLHSLSVSDISIYHRCSWHLSQ